MSSNTHFKPTLGLLDATMLVAGSMIGSGIFIVSADITRNVGSAGWLIFVWLLTGFMTLTAALSYGELSAMFPKAGGQYVYLKEAFNPLVGFLYGWSFFAVIQTGTIAAVGVAFSKFAAYLFPALSEHHILIDLVYFKISAAQIVAIILVILLTYINTRGVKEGKLIQTTFTLAKLLALFGLIIFGFLLGAKAGVWDANWLHGWDFGKLARTAGGSEDVFIGETIQKTPYEGWGPIIGAVAAAMVGSVFSSDAWNNVTFIAGEIKSPEKNIGLSLFFGTLIVTVIYVCANIMYTAVLPLNEIAFAENDRVAVAASTEIFGSVGTKVIAIMIMVSTFGCNNGLILSGARVYYTMAKDGLFFKQVANLNENGVPAKGLWVQCIWACILCLSGKYGDLLDYVVVVALVFYILTIIGIFRLRRLRPDVARPYKAFGYPVLPAIYILLATAMCVALLIYKPTFASFGILIVLLGVPVYYLAVAGKKDN
ncbi:APC family permease [Flavihumibacter petaseus]|uniref:Putative APC family transporter n=1 Tax=Flavihumibacter petaseus NBRC 106054 TaxID=1220578 RepID=A0A0E9MU39_9BACT|nr:amino acid permease [Flavihumibacter petaseus]GAO41084.1 putative APC family transporter [Flavihumibacter petaseus NBRC 106054]